LKLDEISEITILLILLFSFDYNTKIQNLKELDFHVHFITFYTFKINNANLSECLNNFVNN